MVARMSATSVLVQGQIPRRHGGAGPTRRHIMLAAAVLLVLEVAGFGYFVAPGRTAGSRRCRSP
jgi:hypothetical protein